MSQRIYKWPLEITDKQVLDLPVGAEILSVGNQNEKLVLWALNNGDIQNTERRTLYVFGTGELLPEIEGGDAEYIGTVVMQNGLLVLHVFDLVPFEEEA